MQAFTVTGYSPLYHHFNLNFSKKNFKLFANNNNNNNSNNNNNNNSSSSNNNNNNNNNGHAFPSFLPKEIHQIKDPFARNLALRIERLPVQVSFSEKCIMSSCIRPSIQGKNNPVVLLHGFDSSCLEWRSTYPLLEEAGLESWAVDILGWGFSDLEKLPSCDVASKRAHLYQFWKSYIRRPMVLVGPSLGAAIAIDFALHHPEAVSQLILIDGSVYSEGIGMLAKMPSVVANAGLALLRSAPLRFYVNLLVFSSVPYSTNWDWMNVSRLPCFQPWWREATLSFMASGGYNVASQINQVKQPVLIIWGEEDQIISKKLAVKLYCELQDATLRLIPDCGHIPHVEKPGAVASLILKFVENGHC